MRRKWFPLVYLVSGLGTVWQHCDCPHAHTMLNVRCFYWSIYIYHMHKFVFEFISHWQYSNTMHRASGICISIVTRTIRCVRLCPCTTNNSQRLSFVCQSYYGLFGHNEAAPNDSFPQFHSSCRWISFGRVICTETLWIGIDVHIYYY